MSRTLGQEIGRRNPDAALDVKKKGDLCLVDEKTSVGVEIEMENLSVNYMQRANMDGWERKSDGSLRGSSREFVFSSPLRGDSVIAALETLEDAFEDKKFVQHKNLRTSMHVHVNMLGVSKTQLLAVMISGILADSAIFGMTEQNREYLGYSRKSEEVLITGISELHRHKDNPDTFPLYRAAGRYFSVNTAALSKYGTIEFRHFATPDNIQEAVDNINACLKVKQCGLVAWEQAGTDEVRYDLEAMYHLVRAQVEAAFGNQHEMMPVERFLTLVDEQKAYMEYAPAEAVVESDVIGLEEVPVPEPVMASNPSPRNPAAEVEYESEASTIEDRDMVELEALLERANGWRGGVTTERREMINELLRRLSVAREPVIIMPHTWADLRYSSNYRRGMLNNHVAQFSSGIAGDPDTYYRIVDDFVDQTVITYEETMARARQEMRDERDRRARLTGSPFYTMYGADNMVRLTTASSTYGQVVNPFTARTENGDEPLF